MEPETSNAVTATTFEPIIEAITSVLNVDLLVSLVSVVLPVALGFFVFYWGYGFITRKFASASRKGKM